MSGNGKEYRAALLPASARGQAPYRLDDPLILFRLHELASSLASWAQCLSCWCGDLSGAARN